MVNTIENVIKGILILVNILFFEISFSAQLDKPEFFDEHYKYATNIQKISEFCSTYKSEKDISDKNNNKSSENRFNNDEIKCIKLWADIGYISIINKLMDNINNSQTANNATKRYLYSVLDEYYLKFILIRKKHSEFIGEYFSRNDISKDDFKNVVLPDSIKKDYDNVIEEMKADIRNDTEDIKKGKPSKFNKLSKFRELAKNDVIAQVMNYSSGESEDASGISFFYPVDNDNGKCIYKLAIDKSTYLGAMSAEMIEGFSQLNNLPGMKGAFPTVDLKGNIDLGKVDLNNFTFYKINSQNKKTREPILAYQTKVEGLPDYFNCDSKQCNIERLKRGWNLVKEKCKGTQKAF